MTTRPEIFLSAASKDLKSCRQLVRDAVLTLGCVPVVQDHFPPGAGEVRAMLRERSAGCQAVIHRRADRGCLVAASRLQRSVPGRTAFP